MKKVLQKLLSVLLVLTMLFGSFTEASAYSKGIFDPPLKIGVISDPHTFPESYVNNTSEVYLHEAYCDSKLMGESMAILKAALETIAIRKVKGLYNMEYLILPGDLTSEGEKLAHIENAAMFEAFEAQTGIEVFVINGNHDVNNYKASDYNGPSGQRITANENPELLLTTPEDFMQIYANFGYNQADRVFTPSSGKAGGLSYSVGMRGGYRLLAIDSCVYSADITSGGTDSKEGRMNITPELAAWVVSESKQAAKNGETVIAMAHGSLVEHFDLQRFLSKNSTIYDNEILASQFADAGMHFIFTGHMHSNDAASFISANNETIYDIETCELSAYPCTYREASFSKGLVQGTVNCGLANVDCDTESPVDISNVSDQYGVIEKPFSENYCMPMLYGGSVEDGIRNSGIGYFNNAFLFRATDAIHEALPDGLAGLLRKNGIDIGAELTKNSPALKASIKGFNLTPAAFSKFLNAVVAKIDNKYIFDTTLTEELISAAVARFASFEISPGNSATAFGKIALLALEYNAAGNENPENNPEIIEAVSALRTQAGADRFIAELLDIVINDVLFNELLPSISLNELDMLLPADVMLMFRKIAGDDLSVGGILDLILNNTAERMNKLPFVQIDSGRDLLKALVYTAGAKYLNSKARLDISSAFADIIVSFTTDENPRKLSDYDTTLEYKGKVTVVPTAENYRLPADIVLSKGANPGEIQIEWHTLPGIEGSDIRLTPAPAGAVTAAPNVRVEKEIPAVDLGFLKLYKTVSLLTHTVSVSGLETGVEYTFSIGDSARGLMSSPVPFTISPNGEIHQNNQTGNEFFTKLIAVFELIITAFHSIGTIFKFFTAA